MTPWDSNNLTAAHTARELANDEPAAAPRPAPRVLVFADTGKTAMFACASCGKCYSTAIYACKEDRAIQEARRGADECCAPRHCACGTEIEKMWTACAPCRERHKLQRATVVTDYKGPVSADGYEGGWGDGYFENVADLLEACATYKVAPPAYCHPCEASPLALDLDRILEGACDDQHENAADQIVGADALDAAIEAFNAAQTCVTYWPITSEVIVLDQEGFAALRDDPKEVTHD